MPSRSKFSRDLQHLDQHHATAGWLVAGDPVAAELAPQWVDASRRVGREILAREQPAVGLHVGGDGVRDLTAIEDVSSVLGDAPQSRRHFGILQCVAQSLEAAVGVEVDAPPGFGEAEALLCQHAPAAVVVCPEEPHVRADRDTRLGMSDGRCHHVCPVHAAVLGLRLEVGLETTRHGDRLIADVVDVILQEEAEAVPRLADDQVLPHLRRGRGGSLAVEVDKGVDAGFGEIDLHAAEAGDAAHLGIDNTLHQRRYDGRVDRITATPQSLDPGLSCFGLRRRYDPLLHQMLKPARSRSRRS